MKGYTTLVFGLLRLGYQSAALERMRGEAANAAIRDAKAPRRPHHLVAEILYGEESEGPGIGGY